MTIFGILDFCRYCVCCLYITCITASAADTAWCRIRCGIIRTEGLREHFIAGAVHMLHGTLGNKCLWGIEVWLEAFLNYTLDGGGWLTFLS